MIRSFISLLIFPLLFIGLKNYFIYEITIGDARILDLNIDIINYFDHISKLLILSILILFLSILSSNYLIKSQVALLNIYFPLINFTWFFIRLIAIIIAGIFLFIIFLLFNYLIPFFSPKGLYFISIITLFGGGLGAIQIILSIVNKFTKVSSMKVHGFTITEQDQPELFKLIKSVSKKINSIFPDNVILTSERDFFVSSSNLRLYNHKYDKKIKGNSLCIPLLVFKVLTKDELTGIIGHELAHFSGKDTQYSIKYSKIAGSLKKIFKEFKRLLKATLYYEGLEYGLFVIYRFFLLMILFPIIFLHDNLIKKNILNSKNKELRADKIGSSVCEKKKSFISGLCKFCIYSNIWGSAESEIFNKRKSVKTKKTLTREFTKLLDDYYANFNPEKDLNNIMIFEMLHPSDTHPSIHARAENLNIDVQKFKKSDLITLDLSAMKIINNYDYIDKELTAI